MGTPDAITPPTTPTLAQVASPPPPEFTPPWLQKTGPFFESPVVNVPAAPMEGPSAKVDGVPPNSKTPQGELIRASALIKTEGAIWQVVGAEQVYERTLAESGNAAAAAQLVWGASKELVAAVDSELATFVGPNANPDDLKEARDDLLADHADFDPNADRIAGGALDPIFIRRLANRPDALAAATADFDRASSRLDSTFAAMDDTWPCIPVYLKQLQQAAAVKQAVWSEACRKADGGTDAKRQAECRLGLEAANKDKDRVNSRYFVETHSNLKYARAVNASREYKRFVTMQNLGDPSSVTETIRREFVNIRRELNDAWFDAFLDARDRDAKDGVPESEYSKECAREFGRASLVRVGFDE
jgi:hypothetical protein